MTHIMIEIVRFGANTSVKGGQIANSESTKEEKAFANELVQALLTDFLQSFMEGAREVAREHRGAGGSGGADGKAGGGEFSEEVEGREVKPYLNIRVEVAAEIAKTFEKQIVVICAWSHEHKQLHVTTYGSGPNDKISAAECGEICAKALGMDLCASKVHEDFRTVGAAKNAQLRDLAERMVHTLRSYQFGNSEPGLAKDLADEVEAIIKGGGK